MLGGSRRGGCFARSTSMHFYISSWKFDPSGKPSLNDTIQTTISVQSPDRTTPVHVPNRSVNSARRTLEPIKCPGRNHTAQYDALLTTSDEFARGQSNPAPCRNVRPGLHISHSICQRCVLYSTPRS
jgi:hypothetical protein